MYIGAFILAMLSPVSMFLAGLLWRLHPPKKEGGGLAYRTELSTRSQQTWDFAHTQFAKLLLRLGVILSLITVILMVVFQAHYTSFVLWLIGGQMVFFCLAAFLVDLLLKNLFDEHGNRL